MIKTISVPSPAGAFNLVYYTPDTGTGPWPVFIMFPGDGEAGNDPSKAYINGPMVFVKNGWNPNFIVVFAQTPYHGGTFGNPVALAFLRTAIQYITTNLPVDKAHVYLTGLSYGADHVMYYVQKEDPAYYIPIAGIVPMSMGMYGSVGSYPNDSLGGNDSRFAKMRVLCFCGTLDSTVFLFAMERFVGLLKAAGYNADIVLYPAGHTGWNQFYDNTYKGPNKALNIYDDELQSTGYVPVVVAPPPVVTPPVVKTIKSILITYTDGSSETKP